MKPPPGLLGAALLFWGWQTGLLWIGAGAAAAVEFAHVLKSRWEFTQPDLDRVWNLCVALFLGATLYAFFSNENLTAMSDMLQENSPSSRLATVHQGKRSLFQLLQWLPIMFLPMALAQAYSQKDRLDLSTFSWWLRRQRNSSGAPAHLWPGTNIGYPYFACCLFAASAANHRTLWFAAGLVALVAWALWLHRSRSHSPIGWAASLLGALALGVAMQLGMIETQKLLQRLDEVLLARWSGARNYEASESQTRIGAIGRMKLSGRIVLRVDAQEQSPPPLLREASFNLFHAPYWSSSRRDFERLGPEADQTSWVLDEAGRAAHTVRIAGALPGGSGLLALPHGVRRLEQLPALSLATNLYGSVRVEDGPGFVQFDAAYGNGRSIDAGPKEDDLEIPFRESAALEEIARLLRLDQLGPVDAVQTVERFFAENFAYSTWQGWQHQADSKRSALTRFLLEHRSGHCEYFATATALLLRQAGIPARYTTGYAVQEKKGRYYVVRERHAHAWALGWIDGAWREIDTTPGAWASAEAERASVLEPIRDLFSRLWFEVSRWRWGHAEFKQYVLWLAVPALVLAFGKLLFQRQWSRARRDPLASGAPPRPGLDSEFFLIEARLADAGLGRQPGETGSAWLRRIGSAGSVPVEGLDLLLGSHYRLRFDPLGLDATERAKLRQHARAWLCEARLGR